MHFLLLQNSAKSKKLYLGKQTTKVKAKIKKILTALCKDCR